MNPQIVIIAVGLIPRHIGENTPHLAELAKKHGARPLAGVFPAVTLTSQASMLTGLRPAEHGAVGNGWLYRDTMEARLWQQSRTLVNGEFFYETWQKRFGEAAVSRPAENCPPAGNFGKTAKLFWWFNQGTTADWTLTPKPYYGCDGDKVFAIHGAPGGFAAETETACGKFPFGAFWGPLAGAPSSEWIARTAARTIRTYRPGLTLVYLPHLDYDLQRFGATGAHLPQALKTLDRCAGEVIAAGREIGADLTVVSEYGIRDVSRVVYPNRVLREHGFLTVRPGPFGEVLETFQSRAFAVADHQIAHIYIRRAEDIPEVKRILENTPGVGEVLDTNGKRAYGIDHPRSGELIVLAAPDAWCSWQYFLDEKAAPDYAFTINIHRKPGYDPAEMFFNEKWRFPLLHAGARVLRKKLGFRMKFDVISHDQSRIRGSHGLPPATPEDGAVFLSTRPAPENIAMTDIGRFVLGDLPC